MKRNFNIYIMVLGLTFYALANVMAQTSVKVKIYASDGTKTDSLVVAVDLLGTDAPNDSISATFREKELPPQPPSGVYDIRLVARDGGTAYGQGLKTDIRYLGSATQSDTFRINFRSSTEGGATVFSWQAELDTVAGGRWRIVDVLGGGFVNVDMTTQTSYAIPASYVPAPATGGTILIIKQDAAAFRTFRMDSLALASDAKGKNKAVKQKADKVDFKFMLVAPAQASSLILKFSMITSGVITSGTAKTDTFTTWANAKLVTYSATINVGDTLQVDGRGFKGKEVKTSFVWATVPKVTKGTITTYLNNTPRLPSPNLFNLVEDLYQQSAFGGTEGLVVGLASNNFRVYHPKAKDVYKTLNNKGILHASGPKCLAKFDNGKDVTKPIKTVKTDKINNRLLAEQIALKINIASSDHGKTPPGFGDLRYVSDDSLNGKRVRDIADQVDHILSCDTLIKGSTLSFAQWLAVVQDLNNAFSGALDTIAWSGKLSYRAVRPVSDVPFLQRDSNILPFVVQTVHQSSVASSVPDKYELGQNYPNPFNPTTTIEFSLAEDAVVTLKVYNMLGQEIATLLNNESMLEGANDVEFDATSFASGVYYYRLIVNDGQFQQIKKMMLMK